MALSGNEENLVDWIRDLEIPFEPEDGDMVTDVIVMARVVNPKRSGSHFYYGTNKGIDPITRMGLLACGKSLEDQQSDWVSVDEDDDD